MCTHRKPVDYTPVDYTPVDYTIELENTTSTHHRDLYVGRINRRRNDF